MVPSSKNKIVKGCGFHHIALQAAHWDETVHFYRDIMGMVVVREIALPDRKLIQMDMGDGGLLEVFSMTAPPTPTQEQQNPGAFLHLGLCIDDLDAVVNRVRESGYEIIEGPREIQSEGMHARIAFFRGPSGETVELFQPA
jgi:glyoxylase I family protein